MTETPRKSRRKILIATLVGVPLALLLGAGFLHAQHFVQHHAHSGPAAPLVHGGQVHAMLAKVGASTRSRSGSLSPRSRKRSLRRSHITVLRICPPTSKAARRGVCSPGPPSECARRS